MFEFYSLLVTPKMSFNNFYFHCFQLIICRNVWQRDSPVPAVWHPHDPPR
jgi:hypothetical protein